MARAPRQTIWKSEMLVSDAVGRLMEFWGFKRNMGRLWTVLYLSEKPLSAADLRDRLQMSAGAISMTVNELSRWGVVKKVWIQGERKDYFTAEGNFWKMISRVLNERERAEILEAIDAMEEALEYLNEKLASAEGADRERARVQKERVLQLLELAKLGKQLLERLIRQGQVDATPLLKVLLGVRKE